MCFKPLLCRRHPWSFCLSSKQFILYLFWSTLFSFDKTDCRSLPINSPWELFLFPALSNRLDEFQHTVILSTLISSSQRIQFRHFLLGSYWAVFNFIFRRNFLFQSVRPISLSAFEIVENVVAIFSPPNSNIISSPISGYHHGWRPLIIFRHIKGLFSFRPRSTIISIFRSFQFES